MTQPEPRVAPGALRRAARVLGLVSFVAVLFVSDIRLCPSALLFHLPCPACGLTRASVALLRGDVALALRFHPLAPLVAPCVGAYIAAEIYWEITRGSSSPRPWSRPAERVFGVLAVLGVILWAARFAGAFGGPVAV